jgi:hypothetical protein
MNYRNAIPKDLNQLTELFDAYRMFYRKATDLEASLGANEIKLKRGTLSSGLYFCKVQSDTKLYKITKLILE